MGGAFGVSPRPRQCLSGVPIPEGWPPGCPSLSLLPAVLQRQAAAVGAGQSEANRVVW